MLTGRFGDTSGRPYFEGRLYFPRLNLYTDVSFLVDTGADRTLLMPDDGRRTGLDYSQLQGSEGVGGVCGELECFVEEAIIVFTDPGQNLYAYHIDLLIAPASPDLGRTPSLLGRDILGRWATSHDPTRGILTFEVHSADLVIPLQP